MIALVLDDPRVQPLDGAVDGLALGREAAIAHPLETRHQAAQSGNRQAPVPAVLAPVVERLDHRVDQHRERREVVIAVLLALARRVKDDHAQVHVNLRRRQSEALGVDHGLDHIGDQRLDLGRRRVGHLLGTHAQRRVAH